METTYNKQEVFCTKATVLQIHDISHSVTAEYAKFAVLTGHVQRILEMSGEKLEMSNEAQNNFAYCDCESQMSTTLYLLCYSSGAIHIYVSKWVWLNNTIHPAMKLDMNYGVCSVIGWKLFKNNIFKQYIQTFKYLTYGYKIKIWWMHFWANSFCNLPITSDHCHMDYLL